MQRAILTAALAALVVGLMASTAFASGSGGSLVAKQIAALQKTSKAQAREIAALQSQVSNLQDQVAESGGSALTSQVATLQGNVNTLNAVVTCRVAQLFTIDYTFVDLFALLTGQPEQFAGQVVPDNGTCAQVGLTPPSPAAAPLRPAAESPEQLGLEAIAIELGVAP